MTAGHAPAAYDTAQGGQQYPTARTQGPEHRMPDLETLGAEEILQLAHQLHSAEIGNALALAYSFWNPGTNAQRLASVLPIFEAVVQLGYASWPLSIRDIVAGRKILDVGCGNTLYGAALRGLGAREYVGIDPRAELERRRFKNIKLKTAASVPFTLGELAERLGGITYLRTTEIAWRSEFDLALMHTVTEHVLDLDACFAAIARALRPGGLIWFLHDNFYSWSGHHQHPRRVSDFDPDNEQHRQFADWCHLSFVAPEGHYFHQHLNKIRQDELRTLTEKHFEIMEWTEIPDRAPARKRLTPEILDRLPDYTKRELTTKHVICTGRVR